MKKNNNKMILSASAFNSCMIEFTIPDFNETIIKNIISLYLSFSNIELREVVFRTQWFIGQYCSEREGRGYRCYCTSVPLSLYFIAILGRLFEMGYFLLSHMFFQKFFQKNKT